MRRASTALVVAAIALLGILAAADALRSDEPPAREPAAATTTRERPPTLAETLQEELIFGRIVYSDAECHLHSRVLPRLVDEGPLLQPARCRLDSTDGWILHEGERLSPNWRFIARCREGKIVVREPDTGTVRRRVDGCAPTWRPPVGNRLTWARGETIYERGRPLLTPRDLHTIARRHPNIAHLRARFRVHVVDLAWMNADHLVASFEIRSRFVPHEYLAVLLEGKTVIGQATSFQDRLGRWFATPDGSFAAAEEGTILTADGLTLPRPDDLPQGRAVAFSPDERWLAYVTGRSIYVIGTPSNNEPGRIIRLPIAARDLVWERVSQATQVGPPIRR